MNGFLELKITVSQEMEKLSYQLQSKLNFTSQFLCMGTIVVESFIG